MTPRLVAVALPLLFSAAFLHAEDWTVKGKIYRNIHVTQINPDTVSVTYEGGTGRLYLSELTPELQSKFKDAAENAKAFAVIEGKAVTDPIAHLVVSLSGLGGMWMNGMSPIIRLPKNAAPEDVASKVLQVEGSKNCRVIRVEQVQIDDDMPSSSFTAVLVHTDISDKIVLLRYFDQGTFWWSRVFESGY